MPPVPRIIPRPADFDIDIFREMYRSRAVTMAGIDPRLNASRIAERLGVSRARVAIRLKEWVRYGLLQRYDVWPNPALFGYTGFTADLRVSDRRAKDDLIERLALVDGAVGGLDLVGDWITTQFLVRDPVEAARKVQLLRGLRGVAEVGEPILWAKLEPERELTPLDLRIVRVLRQYPTASLAEVARHVGVSTRTMTTRYGRLVEGLAVWFVPVLDFRALTQPVVSLSLWLRNARDHEPIARALREAYPQTLEFHRLGFGPILPDSVAVFFTLCPSAAGVEELERYVRALPGVTDAEVLTMIRILSFPEMFDRLVRDASSSAPAPKDRTAPYRRGKG